MQPGRKKPKARRKPPATYQRAPESSQTKSVVKAEKTVGNEPISQQVPRNPERQGRRNKK